MKTHLPTKLYATLIAAITAGSVTLAGEEPKTQGTITVGSGVYTYSTDADGTVTSVFTGDGTTGSFNEGYTKANGHIGGIAGEYVNIDGNKRVATNTDLTIGGNDINGVAIETRLNRVTASGVKGYAVTGDKKVTVKEGATVNLLIGGYDLDTKYGIPALTIPTEASQYSTGVPFAPKSSENAVISINVEGGTVGQIYGAYISSNVAANEINAAKKKLEGEELDAYLANPAWAHNEKIDINISGGNTGLVLGGGFHGAANGGVEITVSGDTTTVDEIYGGSYGTSNFSGYADNTAVTIKGGTVTGSVYGGGYNHLSRVNGDTSVSLSGGTVKGNVYGAGNGDKVGGNSSVTLTGDNTLVEGTVYGGGINGAIVEGNRTLNLGTEEEAFNGSVNAADFSEINANNGNITIASYTPSADENAELTLNIGEQANLQINGDLIVDTLNLNGGVVIVLNGELTANSVTLGNPNYKIFNPGFVGGDENNGFKQEDGREAVGVDIGEVAGTVTDMDGITYYYDDALGKYIAPGDTLWDTYYINTEDHAASVMELQEASNNQLELVVMQTGTLQADENIRVEATQGEGLSRGTINVSNGAELSGSVENTDVNISSGTVGATLTGTTAVNVTGIGTISGNNSQTGDTTITGPDAKLTVGSETALGDSSVYLRGHGALDLGGFALDNPIHVEGCTVSGASLYDGKMTVSGDLELTDETTRAAWVTLTESGSLNKGNTLVTRGFELQGRDRTIATNLTVLDDGAIVLHSGNALTITGNLTIGKGVCITLADGGYAEGDELLTWTGTLTGNVADMLLDAEGEFLLEQDGKTIKLALPQPPEEDKPVIDPGEDEEDKPVVGPGEDEEDKPVVGPGEPSTPLPPADSELPEPVFDQATADVLAQGNWGIFTASRAFTEAIQGQRNNMGCIAGGRGTAWASLLGGMTDISGSGMASGSDITLFGAAVGVDMKLGKRSSLGVAFGYTDGEVSADGLGDIDQETGHIALYGEHGLKRFAANSCLSLDWVAATGTTESKYMGTKWEQDSVQLNARLSWHQKVTERFSYNVFGGLEYFASESDRVQNCKSGSVQNLRGELGIGVRYVPRGASRSIVDEKSSMVNTVPGCERVVLYGEVSYINDMVRNNPSIEVNGLRGSGANPGRQGVGVEAGATIRIGERWSANANYSFNAMDDSNEHILNIGASRTF